MRSITRHDPDHLCSTRIASPEDSYGPVLGVDRHSLKGAEEEFPVFVLPAPRGRSHNPVCVSSAASSGRSFNPIPWKHPVCALDPPGASAGRASARARAHPRSTAGQYCSRSSTTGRDGRSSRRCAWLGGPGDLPRSTESTALHHAHRKPLDARRSGGGHGGAQPRLGGNRSPATRGRRWSMSICRRGHFVHLAAKTSSREGADRRVCMSTYKEW